MTSFQVQYSESKSGCRRLSAEAKIEADGDRAESEFITLAAGRNGKPTSHTSTWAKCPEMQQAAL